MARGKDHDYTLPDHKSRDEPSKKKGPPQPMPANIIKAGWRGETKETLMAKPDMLNASIRALPRAYLVPPRPSAAAKKSSEWHKNNKRKLESDSGMDAPIAPSTAGVFPAFPPPADIPRPAPHPAYGAVEEIKWSFTKNQWTYIYTSGMELTSPPMLAPVSTFPPAVPESMVADYFITEQPAYDT